MALVVTGANRHDASPLEAVLGSIIIEQPDIVERSQHLCLDRGYAGEPALAIIVVRGCIPHSKSRGQEQVEKTHHSAYRARRGVVEAAHS